MTDLENQLNEEEIITGEDADMTPDDWKALAKEQAAAQARKPRPLTMRMNGQNFAWDGSKYMLAK